MKTIKKLTFLFVIYLNFSGSVMALQCGKRIVDVGDSKIKVFSRCGEPDFTETRERKYPSFCNNREYNSNRYNSYNQNYTNQSHYQDCQIEIIDVWTYNFGPRKFMRELIFIRGNLKKINLLEYGY